MANNLFISYDLDAPGQNYQAVHTAIQALGNAVKVNLSVYYVKTTVSAEDAAKRIQKALDTNDRLLVVDASSNEAYWFNPLGNASDFMQQNWSR